MVALQTLRLLGRELPLQLGESLALLLRTAHEKLLVRVGHERVVELLDGSRRRPTLGGDPETRLETFIFEYSGDLYGQEIGVRLVRFLRPDAKFAGLEELKVAIAEDERQARAVLK